MEATHSAPLASKASPETSFWLMPCAARSMRRTSVPSRRISTNWLPALYEPSHRLPLVGSIASPAQLCTLTGTAMLRSSTPVLALISRSWLPLLSVMNRLPVTASYTPAVRS